MQSNLLIGLMRQNYLQRGIVTLLFVLILVDVASPQFCCEESKELCARETDSIIVCINDNSAIVITTTADHSKDEHSQPASNDEGCFCCCAHFLVSFGPGMIKPKFEFQLTDSDNNFLPFPPRKNLFHPPRFI
jgi:hypothetical protein